MSKSNLLTTNFNGYLPPQDIEIEEHILGSIISGYAILKDHLRFFYPEIFYKNNHAIIANMINRMIEDKVESIDIMTLISRLRISGELDEVGGPYHLSQLTNSVSSIHPSHFEEKLMILIQHYVQREVMRFSIEMHTAAVRNNTDTFELISRYDGFLKNINRLFHHNTPISIKDIANKAISEIEQMTVTKIIPDTIQTQWKALNDKINYIEPIDLVILAARPGMGKSAMAMQIAMHNAFTQNKDIGIFNLEMKSRQLVIRMLSTTTKINSRRLKTGDLLDEDIQKLKNTAESWPNRIHIADHPVLTLRNFELAVLKLKSEHNVKLIILDYLQLMNAEKKSNNRVNDISDITRGLKQIALTTEIPIIALSQLSREVEKRKGNKKPELSDLRDSGSIEQDADSVWFIYRPAYYGFKEDKEGNDISNVAEIIIAKHRNGDTSSAILSWDGRYTSFNEISEQENLQDNFDEPFTNF